jgi:hypothetical protein
MNLFIYLLVILLFVFGRLELFDRLYFPHFTLVCLLFFVCVYRFKKILLDLNFIVLFSFFLFSTFITSMVAFELKSTIAATQLILFVAAVFVPYLYVNNQRTLILFARAVFIGVLLNALMGLVQSILWISKYGFVLIAEGEWFRVKGFALSPADYVMQLIVGLFIGEGLPNRLLRGSSKLIFVVCLLLSNSRTALVVLALLIVRSISKLEKQTLFKLLILTVVLVVSFNDNPALLLIEDRFMDIFNPDYNIKRIVTFEYVAERIFSDPIHFLIGHGYGTFIFFNPIELEDYNNTHNMYLHLFYSGGILGFLSFYGIYIFLISKIYFFYRGTIKYSVLNIISSGLLYLMLVVSIIGLVETNLVGVGSSIAIGLSLGIGFSGYRISINSSEIKAGF